MKIKLSFFLFEVFFHVLLTMKLMFSARVLQKKRIKSPSSVAEDESEAERNEEKEYIKNLKRISFRPSPESCIVALLGLEIFLI